MTLVELARLVKEMRDTQRRYFRERNNTVLEQSKALEKRVDREVADILEGPSLFGGGDR